MQRSLTISMILAVIAILSVSFTVAARSEAFSLLEGDTLQISCAGNKLTLNQTGETEATASCEAEQISLAVTSLVLIDADADQEIGPLLDGDILNLAELPTRNLNIRADTNPAVVGSVRFELNSPDNARYENIAPYTLAGDSNGDYGSLTLAAGEYTLTAIPFSESRGGGVAGTALRVSFIVVDEDGGEEPSPPAPPTDPEPNPGPDPQPTDPPTSSVPACPDHDPTQWHGLYDAQRNCHYDHTHNADPAAVDAIFGSAGALYGGQSISYPWETPNENIHKHQGYKYAVDIKTGCFNEGYEYLGQTNCIKAWRIQYHAIGGARGANVRYHSYWTEIQVCTPDDSRCGTIKTGGWADFGILHAPYKTAIIPLPVDPNPVQQSIHSDPYRGHNTINLAIERAKYGNDNRSIWTSDRRYGYNQLTDFFFRILDDWGGIDPSNPSELHFICPDHKCKYNSSEHHVFAVKARIPKQLDTDGDGFVTYSGFTDRQGNIINSCSPLGVDCIPLEIVNAPVGTGIFSRNTSGPRPAGEVVPEFDMSPAGQFWIKYPN